MIRVAYSRILLCISFAHFVTTDRQSQFKEQLHVQQLVLLPFVEMSSFGPRVLPCIKSMFSTLLTETEKAKIKPAAILMQRHGRREVTNHNEVLGVLQAFASAQNQEVVLFDQLPFADAVKLFGRATVVAGPHGSGFTNMIWAPRGTVIIEFLPYAKSRPQDFMDLYDAMAAALGHRYCAVPVPDATRGGWWSNTMAVSKEAFGEALARCTVGSP
jgi:hypothetical protein